MKNLKFTKPKKQVNLFRKVYNHHNEILTGRFRREGLVYCTISLTVILCFYDK